MRTGIKGIRLIQLYENCKLEAYKCPAGIWTIGWGHTRNVKEGDVITQEEADRIFREDLTDPETCANNASRRLNQNQFDAIVSLVYNIGWGNFDKSEVKRLVASNPASEWIKDAFMQHVYAKDPKTGKHVKLAGLVTRRKKEVELYYSTEA
jgi:lysozyme